MSTQIFKNNVPNELLFNLLDSICLKNEKHYTFNGEAFKRGVYKENIQNFINECTQYYHLSKRKYLEKKLQLNLKHLFRNCFYIFRFTHRIVMQNRNTCCK